MRKPNILWLLSTGYGRILIMVKFIKNLKFAVQIHWMGLDFCLINPLSQCRSSLQSTPNRNRKHDRITGYESAVKKAVFAHMAMKMEQAMEVRLSRDWWRGIFMPVVFNSSRILRIKLSRWVRKKLTKYPVIPHSGRNRYRKMTSRKEVRILYRTQMCCWPKPLVMASVMASQ